MTAELLLAAYGPNEEGDDDKDDDDGYEYYEALKRAWYVTLYE